MGECLFSLPVQVLFRAASWLCLPDIAALLSMSCWFHAYGRNDALWIAIAHNRYPDPLLAGLYHTYKELVLDGNLRRFWKELPVVLQHDGVRTPITIFSSLEEVAGMLRQPPLVLFYWLSDHLSVSSKIRSNQYCFKGWVNESQVFKEAITTFAMRFAICSACRSLGTELQFDKRALVVHCPFCQCHSQQHVCRKLFKRMRQVAESDDSDVVWHTDTSFEAVRRRQEQVAMEHPWLLTEPDEEGSGSDSSESSEC
jgi:hypothetical protein